MRQALKMSAFLLSLLPVLPFYFLYRLASILAPEKVVFAGFSQLFSIAPGIPGDYLRKAFYWLTMKKCASECTIAFGTFFPSSNVEIGKHVYIGADCIIGESVIAPDVMIGSHVNVISGGATHGYGRIDIPMRLQEGKTLPVRIGEDTWVGNCAIIMANVGRKCLVGAGSVVTRDIDDFSVAVGNPARVIRKRAQGEQCDALPAKQS